MTGTLPMINRLLRESGGMVKRRYIYRFLSTGTIEEKVYQRQMSKEGLQKVLQQEQTDYNKGNFFSMEDLRDLFTYRADVRESYAKTCRAQDLVEINRQAFEKWKNMSTKEQWPFVLQAQKVGNVYLKLLHQEMDEMSQEEDDEADSALVGKVALQFEDYENWDSSECGDTCDWPLMCPWHRR